MHNIDARNARKENIYRLSDKFFGKDDKGKELGFTNYYMIIDGKPFYAIAGECHFSRVVESQWKDTILKMKAGGINIISTYIFWNVHEEEEGKFDFTGRRNLRKFVELCGKYGMYVIIRIGPFDHGEMRNGGLPDWLYGKPFDVRSDNPGFMHYTRLLYRAIAGEVKGLLYKDGGPVIGTQIENEYQHSAAPWEMTTGISDEWIPGGSDGDAYMLKLQQIAKEEGIVTPFYTCTGWGGAATPTDDMLSLWGGYAFWPWMFYGKKEYRHPATPEYIYRDNHNNGVTKTYNFDPTYEPESRPYACCEMGGGMMTSYSYRFQLPYESVSAMANIKLASGCNFLGYYMYRGGNNPVGAHGTPLNESQVSKISYDYQAPIGEFGQVRESYYRLKLLHYFVSAFEDELCSLTTVLPEGSQDIKPEDTYTLRYALRTDGERGFLFINNYQDHAICHDKKDEEITIETKTGNITVSGISLAAGESAILPFNMDLDGITLSYATACPVTAVREGNEITYYFYTPKGMSTRYVFSDGSEFAPDSDTSAHVIENGDKKIKIVTLSFEEAMKFYCFDHNGRKVALLSDHPLTLDGDRLLIEYDDNESVDVDYEQCGAGRYIVKVPQFEDCKTALLEIEYEGDVGHIFNSAGSLLADNFSNGAIWETGLAESGINPGDDITIYITPKKENVTVDVSSTMAGRTEKADNALAVLHSVKFKKVTENVIDLSERSCCDKLSESGLHVF